MDTSMKCRAFAALARAGGGFAMVANDGRESLRGLLHARNQPADDAALAAFKTQVARHLGPLCSAMLVDLMYGGEALDELRASAPGVGRILSVDLFDEPRFGPLAGTSLDREAMTVDALPPDVHALKFYVFWHPDRPPSTRDDDVAFFVSTCARLGVLSLLEGVVQLPADHPMFDESLVAAASEFGAYHPDIYKTQVPTLGRAAADEIQRLAQQVTVAVNAPWVALSNGISAEAYADSVEAVCRGGASGFLAGRATWSPAIGTPDAALELSTTGAQRLQTYIDRVDEAARPWWIAAGLPVPPPSPVGLMTAVE